MAPADDTPGTSPALLSQAEAAAACGVSEATIRRARKAGRIQGVQPDPAGGYRIPVASLIAAGFTLDRVTRNPQVSPNDTPRDTPQEPPVQDDLRGQMEALRARAEDAERRAAVAEAIAAERARSLDDLRLTVKALTATAHPAPAPAPEPAPQPAPSATLTAQDLAEFEALADAAERGELLPMHLDPDTKAAVAAEAAEAVRRALATPTQPATDDDGTHAAAWAEHTDRDLSPATLLRGPAAREYTDALLSNVLADDPETAALFDAARAAAQPAPASRTEPPKPSRWQRLRRRLPGPNA